MHFDVTDYSIVCEAHQWPARRCLEILVHGQKINLLYQHSTRYAVLPTVG